MSSMTPNANDDLSAASADKVRRVVGTPCCKCGHEIEDDDPRKTADGWMCPDCYFAELGDEIERHPICNPRRANSVICLKDATHKPDNPEEGRQET